MSAFPSMLLDHGFAAVKAASLRTAWSPTQRRDRNMFGQAGQLLHFTADEEIYADGCENTSFYRVMSGVVRTCKFRNDGRRQIDSFYLPGDMFGFEAGSEHRLSAEAVSDCAVAAFRWSGVEALTPADDRVARQFLSYAMQSLRRAQDHGLLLGRRSAAQKVAAFLIDLADRGPIADLVDLAMARQDIADYLGLTIETVSRTMSQLERDEMIALPSTRRVRITNRAALQHLIS